MNGQEILNEFMEHKNRIVSLSTEVCSMFEACLNMIKGEIMDKYTYKHGKKQGKEFSLTSDFLHFQ